MDLELQVEAEALLGRRSEEQRRHCDALDASYVELLACPVSPAKADIDALAELVVAFYCEIAKASTEAGKTA